MVLLSSHNICFGSKMRKKNLLIRRSVYSHSPRYNGSCFIEFINSFLAKSTFPFLAIGPVHFCFKSRSSSLNMCLGCSKEPSHRDGSFEYPQHRVWLRSKKNNFQLRTLIWGPGCVVFFICIKISIEHFKANSEDLNQTQHSVAFDLSLHCLSMSH